jgi:succinyl-diaminopimelate desuccinylase
MSERLVQRTLDLCRIPSPIGEERLIADHVERWAEGCFPAKERFRRSHSLVLGDLSDPRPTVTFLGHLDTVPGRADDGPTRIEGDRLFGLGSSDMKGGLAVMMELAETLDRKALSYNPLFVFYGREEGPYLENGLGPLLVERPELSRTALGIAMEPTDGVVQVGCVGSLHATIQFAGRSAHSARPWQGQNAIHAAGPLLTELLTLQPREVRAGGHAFFEVFSVTRAGGGRARNVVPDTFELNLNYRFAPGKSVAEAQEDVRRLVAGRGELVFTDLSPSGHVCTDNPIFQKLIASSGAQVASKQAWTDVAQLSAHGIDAVNFGPGETAQAHQANESTSISALSRVYDQLVAFLSAHP